MLGKIFLVVQTLLLVAIVAKASGPVPDQLKHTFINPSTAAQGGAHLGYSVAMDRDYVVVGAPLDRFAEGFFGGGSVKVFSASTGAILFVLLSPHKYDAGDFGRAVAISGTRVVVGSPGEEGGDAIGAVYVYDLSGLRPTVPIARFVKTMPKDEDNFGYSVAISGTRIAVGENSRRNDYVAEANVFDISSATPTVPVATITMTAVSRARSIATAVALEGNRLAVGMCLETDDDEQGKVSIFDLGGPTPLTPTLTLAMPYSVRGDSFGNAVALSGALLAVGTAYDPLAGQNAGRVYVFNLEGSEPSTPMHALPDPHPERFDQFASSVALRGNLVVVGAVQRNSGIGSAYVYDLTGTDVAVPTYIFETPTSSPSDQFGIAVAISGTRIAVGAPLDDTAAPDGGAAYVFDLSNPAPAVYTLNLNNPSPQVDAGFGGWVAISGNLMAVSSAEDGEAADAGAVYLYRLDTATPTLPFLILRDPHPDTVGQFGRSIAISGSRIVVGRHDTAYLFDLTSEEPTRPVLTFDDPIPSSRGFGARVAIDGDRIAILDGEDGLRPSLSVARVYVYDLNSHDPRVPVAELKDPVPGSSLFFGWGISIFDTRVVVGDPSANDFSQNLGRGAVYIYDLETATSSEPVLTINNPDPYPSGIDFGWSVAIEGARLIAGERWFSPPGLPLVGKAYAFDLSSSTPAIPVLVWNNPSPNAGDFFGSSVGISGARVVIAAPGGDADAYDAGVAYVYDLTSATPTQPLARLKNPTPRAGDGFGAVAIDGEAIAIGTPGDDTVGRNQGAVYVFGPSPYALWKVAELNDPFAPDFGNVDGDGASNFAEYGLLQSPSVANGAALEAEMADYADGARLRMFVPRDPARNDLTLEVQASGALGGPWVTIAKSEGGAPFYGPGYFAGDGAGPGVKSVEVRDTVKTSEAAQRFLRLRMRR